MYYYKGYSIFTLYVKHLEETKMLQIKDLHFSVDEDGTNKEIIKGLDDVEASSLLKRRFEGLKVLLADANLASLDVARRLLVMEGAHVVCVKDGKRAVSEAKKTNFDLVLVDLVMPIISGVEVIETISTLYKKKDINVPIIALTVEGSDFQISDAIKVGAFDCIYKPLHIPELSSIILSFSRKAENTMKETDELITERDKLIDQVTELQKQIYRLQLERDVLEKAAEVIKKDRFNEPIFKFILC